MLQIQKHWETEKTKFNAETLEVAQNKKDLGYKTKDISRGH